VTLSLLAPAIADAFRQPALSDIIRVLSVSLAVASIAVVPQALLERRLAFSSVARLEVGAVALGGVIGIAAALSGFGAWSLVIQTTMVVLASTLLAWRLGGFRPGFVWAIADLRSVAGFSTALTGFNLFNYAARNADNLLIGRALGADALGKYALAYRLMLAPVQAVTWTINRVMFPVYADLQADDGAFQAAYLRTVGLVSFFALPIVVGLGVVAERLVAVLFGPAWAETATVLAILVPVAGIQTILATVGPIYQAKGRGRALLGWGVLSGTVTVAAFGLGLAGGIQGVATAYLVATLALVGPALVIPFRLIHLDARLFLGRLVGPALAAGTMGLLVWVAGRSLPFGLADPVGLAVLVALGVATYLATSVVTNRAALEAIVGPVLRQRAT
jgi:PST family polysaccharide transporter